MITGMDGEQFADTENISLLVLLMVTESRRLTEVCNQDFKRFVSAFQGLNDFRSCSAHPPDQEGDHNPGVALCLLSICEPLGQCSPISLLDLAWSTGRAAGCAILAAEKCRCAETIGAPHSTGHQRGRAWSAITCHHSIWSSTQCIG